MQNLVCHLLVLVKQCQLLKELLVRLVSLRLKPIEHIVALYRLCIKVRIHLEILLSWLLLLEDGRHVNTDLLLVLVALVSVIDHGLITFVDGMLRDVVP